DRRQLLQDVDDALAIGGDAIGPCRTLAFSERTNGIVPSEREIRAGAQSNRVENSDRRTGVACGAKVQLPRLGWLVVRRIECGSRGPQARISGINRNAAVGGVEDIPGI